MIYLSIIIPHFNSINSLVKLLDSIPNNPKIEIIVVDDLSTNCIEEYRKLKKKYKERENILFLSRNEGMPKGAGTCRNIGLKNSTGKYILFADSDDFYVENFLNIISPYLIKDYDIVFFTPYCIIPGLNTEGVRHLPYAQLIKNYLENSNKDNILALKYKFHVPWSKLISRTFINKYQINFDETVASNDVMFSTKVGNKMRIFEASNEVIYVVTQNETSLTRMKENSLFDVRTKVFIEYYHYLKKNIDPKEFKKFSLSGARVLFSVLNEKRGVKQFCKTLKVFLKNKVEIINFNDLKYLKTLLKR